MFALIFLCTFVGYLMGGDLGAAIGLLIACSMWVAMLFVKDED